MSSRSWFRRLSSKRRSETANGTAVAATTKSAADAHSASNSAPENVLRPRVQSASSPETTQAAIEVVVTVPSPDDDSKEWLSESSPPHVPSTPSEASAVVSSTSDVNRDASVYPASDAAHSGGALGPPSQSETKSILSPNATSAAPGQVSRDIAAGVAGVAGIVTMNVIKSKLSTELANLWIENQQQSGAPSALDQVLNTTIGAVELIKDNISAVEENESVIEQIGNTSIGKEVAEFVQQGLRGLADSVPLFMKALDEVAKLHPFIGVAVLAFKAVYNLGEKYVENDRNVIALHEEMREMMRVLLQLKDVKDARIAAPDGTTIQGRMQVLIAKTADDIKACGNACETYSKLRIVVKIVLSPKWQGRFSALASVFTQRRGEFEKALIMHTAVGVDMVNSKLEELQRLTLESAKRMQEMFEERLTSSQREVLLYLQQKGGVEAFQDDEAKLRAVLREKPAFAEVEGVQKGRISQRWQSQKDHPDADKAEQTDQVDTVLVELKMTIESAEEKNMERFSQRFQVRIDRLEIDMKEEIRHEGDRIIDFIKEGPHSRISDPDVRTIWQDMQWKGNAKARHFILALKDYYHDEVESRRRGMEVTSEHDHDDEWTLPYITMPYVQPILEAFDDDASGFITIKEVNTFTNSRPEGWSLRVWLAYWAVGRSLTLKLQAMEIDSIFERMFGLLSYVLPANAPAVYRYLTVWRPVYAVICPLLALPWTGWELQDRFSSYVDQETARLEANLKKVDYVIDQADMVLDIAGAGRVEKSAMALLRLLLRHSLELMQAACNKVIEEKDLTDANASIMMVLDAIDTRYDELELTFTQQRLDLNHHFRTFSGGLFRYYHEVDVLWSFEKVRDSPEYSAYCWSEDLPTLSLPRFVYDHVEEPPDVDYPEYSEVFSPSTESALSVMPSSLVKLVVGTWYLLVYADDLTGLPEMFMRSFTVESSTDDFFEAVAISYTGRTFKLSGTCISGTDHDLVDVSFTISYDDLAEPDVQYTGQFLLDTQTIQGTCAVEEFASERSCHFIMKRTSPRVFCLRPSPLSFQANKPRALWKFALSAVQEQVRRQLWSWSYYRERRAQYKRYWDWSTGNMAEEDAKKFAENGCGLCFEDLSHYTALLKNDLYNRAYSPLYLTSCDHCGTNVTRTRVTCLECETDTRFGAVDLCEDWYCLSSTIDSTTRSDLSKPHLPTHDVMKLRRIIHWRQYGSVYRTARRALLKSKGKVKGLVVAGGAGAQQQTTGGDVLLVVPSLSDRRSSRASMVPPPDIHCAVCGGALSLPCWYCAECSEMEIDVFICTECDSRGGASRSESESVHKKDHTLVRCQEPKKDNAASMERKIASLEEAMLGLKDHMRTMEARNQRLEVMLMELLAQAGKAGLAA